MSDEQVAADPRSVVERWIAAINDRDLEAIVACFDPTYEDEAPTRRGEHVRSDAEGLRLPTDATSAHIG